MRVAGIDCGTNSIRLLVADVAGGRLTDVVRTMQVVRLGQGVDATGRLAPEALARTFAAVAEYGATCRELGVEAIRFVATSATRDAENRAEFVAGVRAEIGVEPEVVDGEEEALLSFRGALGAVADLPGPYLVVDLGGGSTELVLGTTSPVAAWSMDVGCVRMTERHLRTDPPTPAELAAAGADVTAALDAAAPHLPFGRAATLVGLAGTVTTVTAHALDLDRYDPVAIHGTALPTDRALAACRDLMGLSRAKLERLPYLHPGRVDVIAGGALVWSTVISRVRAEVGRAGGNLKRVVTSEHDILDGIALSAAER